MQSRRSITSVLLGLALLCVVAIDGQQKLPVGGTLARKLRGTSIDSLSITLSAGQFFKAVALQTGTDIAITLRDPENRAVLEIDTINGAFGPETVAAIAESSGEYHVEVRLSDPTAGDGEYQIRVEEQREAQPRDREIVAAHANLDKTRRLMREHKPESRKLALELIARVRASFATLQDPYYEGISLLTSGFMLAEAGDIRGALRDNEAATGLFRRANDWYGEGVAWNNTGGMLDILGEPGRALDGYQKALDLYRKVGARSNEANTLNNIGKLHSDRGDWQGALNYYSQALPVLHEQHAAGREAGVLQNMGVAYRTLGEFDQAMVLLEQALAIRRELKDARGQGLSLSGIGRTYELQNAPDKALKACGEALELYKTVGDRLNQVASQRCIGRTLTRTGDFAGAEKSLRQAVETAKGTADRRNTALALSDLASSLRQAGRPGDASESALHALAEFRALGDRSSEEFTLGLMAHIESDRGDLTAARARIEESLKLGETNRMRADSEQLRASFFATRQEAYSFYIDLLMRMRAGSADPRALESLAFEASERARARSLLDMLSESAGQVSEGIDPKLLARQREISDELNAKGARLLPLLARNRQGDPQVAVLRQEISGLERDYQDVEGAIRKNNPRYASLTQPELLGVQQIQEQILDRETLLLEYALGEERSYVWVIGKDSMAAFELPGRGAIEAQAGRVYGLLTARAANVRGESAAARLTRIAQADAALAGAGRELSETILGPAKALLGDKRLVIVPDGGLQRLPFAALPEPGTKAPLLLAHEVSIQPSVSALGLLRKQFAGRKRAPRMLAVFADPVFDASDPRIIGKARSPQASLQASLQGSRAAEGSRVLEHVADPGAGSVAALKIPRLPYTAQEAQQILRVAPDGSNLKAFDFQASRALAIGGQLGQYQYLHFAAHGFLDAEHPDLSALVLSQYDEKGDSLDGFLRVPDVYNSRLGAELVVLSACQTGLGKEVRGEGLMGLTRAFLYAGVPRVIVSLWNVNDRATAELMGSLYRNLLRDGKPAASALRSAQLEMRKQKRWEAPYYWAAFVENGEWK